MDPQWCDGASTTEWNGRSWWTTNGDDDDGVVVVP